MILHNEPSYLIYFGDKKGCCVESYPKFPIKCFEELRLPLHLEKIAFLKQVHSCNGICIDKLDQLESSLNFLEQNGDFIITNVRNIGIGVLTADCLPLIFYDPVHHAVAVVHAGWRGAVANIVEKVINKMEECFNSKASNLITYFGSCAKVCCYQVQQNFLENLEKYSFVKDVVFNRDEQTFFNLPTFVEMQLLNLGVKEASIHKNYNDCTICNTQFHSYRRDNATALRQATIVALK